jgi:hypothetical protein
MTLTIQAQTPLESGADVTSQRYCTGWDTPQAGLFVSPSRCETLAPPQLNSARLGVLLEDPVLAEWAMETASRYQVSALDALGALAKALGRDSRQ